MAVKATAEKMGFKIIKNIYDLSDTLQAVAKTAISNNIPGNQSNKGHSNSIYSVLENATYNINAILYGNDFFKTKGMLNYTDNLETLGKELTSNNLPYKNIFTQSLINKAPLNLYNIFTETFNKEKERFAYYDKKYKDYKTIADWDSKADETIRRYCDKQQRQFEQWRQKISTLPEYKNFIDLLTAAQTQKLYINSHEY